MRIPDYLELASVVCRIDVVVACLSCRPLIENQSTTASSNVSLVALGSSQIVKCVRIVRWADGFLLLKIWKNYALFHLTIVRIHPIAYNHSEYLVEKTLFYRRKCKRSDMCIMLLLSDCSHDELRQVAQLFHHVAAKQSARHTSWMSLLSLRKALGRRE